MAKKITATVGRMGSVNLQADVRAVQELLNRVPQSQGGPMIPLPVDGRCGPSLLEAIDKFQVKNFGRTIEDGKLTPNGMTMMTLNTYDPFPSLTTGSRLMCPHGGSVVITATGRAGAGETELTMASTCIVAGCAFPTPCITVKWVSSPTPTLDARSVGLCMNGMGIPQGTVIIASV